MRQQRIVLASCLLALCIPAGSQALAQNWAQYRGPNASGHSSETGLPVKWGPGDVAWRVTLKGRGQSSPVIWGDRIFLTSALGKGGQRLVMCLDRRNGKVLWEQAITTSASESLHELNTWATSSCATDGQRVVAFFGPAGIHAFDMDGKKLWSRDLGDFPGPWGTAASPIIVGDAVIQNCDAEGPSACLVALNKATGAVLWRTERQAKPRGGWSTPIIIDAPGHRELVLNGEFGVKGYDLATGKELWFCKSFNGRGTPIPAWSNGLLITVNGKPGDVYAVKPGGSGDVTATHMAWHSRRVGGRDLPSPIVVGDHLFVVAMGGTATMYNAKTGQNLWTERLTGHFAPSPVAVGGLIYIQNVEGDTFVIKPGSTLNLLAQNKLDPGADEVFRASLAPSGGQFFARSDTVLYCIGKRAAE